MCISSHKNPTRTVSRDKRRLNRRDLRSVPAAADRFDEKDARAQSPRQYVHGSHLIGERGRLRGGDFKIIRDAALIPRDGKGERMLGRRDRAILSLSFPLEDAQRGQIVVHFLKSAENGLTVVVHRLVVSGSGLFGYAAPEPAIEKNLGGLPCKRPEPAGSLKQRANCCAFEAASAAQSDRREISGARDSDICVGFLDAPLGCRNIGPPLEQFRGQAGGNGWRGSGERNRRQREIRRGLPDQNGDGVLE